MARTFETIYNGMVSEKETLTVLNGLTGSGTNAYQQLLADISTASKVAVWRLFLWIVAYAVWLHESLWDEYAIDIENKSRSAIAGTIYWYVQKIKAFQMGDELVFDDTTGSISYAAIDTEKQIIKYCSIVEFEGKLLIKVAVDDNGPVSLTVEQQNALIDYINKIKFAGTFFQLITEVSDVLNFEIELYYNPLTDFDTLKQACIDGVVNYLKALDFDGYMYRNKLIDALQTVTGIHDVVVLVLEGKHINRDEGNFISIGRYYYPHSGYVKIFGGNDFNNVALAGNNIEVTNSEGVKFKFIPNV